MSHTKVSRTATIWSLFGVVVLCALTVQASSLPPDPDNAALLYYQAFLLRPEPDEVERELVYSNRLEEISTVLRGGELEAYTNIAEKIHQLEEDLKNRDAEPNEPNPYAEYGMYLEPNSYEEKMLQLRQRQKDLRGEDSNKKLRRYLSRCRNAINAAQMASEISECDWGIMYSQGLASRFPQLVEIRPFIRILCADALLLLADGNDRAAFERCLMIRRFAHQVGDDAYLLYCVSKSVAHQALDCIQILLRHTKPDVDTLTWLKNQLVTEEGSPALPARALEIDFEMALQSLRANSSILDNARQAMFKKEELKALVTEQLTQDAGNVVDIQSLTDEELLARAGEPYATFLDSALQAMDSEMSYEEQCSEIQRLTEALEKEFSGDSVAALKMIAHPEKLLTLSIVTACANQVLRIYDVHVRYTVRFNVLMAGIELYLIKARTGQLPEKLPKGMPKDPFTGKDFTYEITGDGFTLSLPDKDLPKRKFPLYEFKVKK